MARYSSDVELILLPAPNPTQVAADRLRSFEPLDPRGADRHSRIPHPARLWSPSGLWSTHRASILLSRLGLRLEKKPAGSAGRHGSLLAKAGAALGARGEPCLRLLASSGGESESRSFRPFRALGECLRAKHVDRPTTLLRLSRSSHAQHGHRGGAPTATHCRQLPRTGAGRGLF